MKLTSFTAAVLAGAMGIVQALPAAHDQQPTDPMNLCCQGLGMNDDSCTGVKCPKPTLTAWHVENSKAELTPADDQKPCCCCDISIPAISCRLRPEKDGCMCAMVVCPPESPTIWPGSTTSPTATPTPTPTDE
ncbi:unnamed protein product [Clonostachys rhizophaga]|uniref:Uncharacterized protein n=1 Tax=Clonostachys rhizophaga TaxID=160324 RepID=A0A9N9YGC1_9HYPO|nr:unnamed protein product [Clonostachys rhizophaga]